MQALGAALVREKQSAWSSELNHSSLSRQLQQQQQQQGQSQRLQQSSKGSRCLLQQTFPQLSQQAVEGLLQSQWSRL